MASRKKTRRTREKVIGLKPIPVTQLRTQIASKKNSPDAKEKEYRHAPRERSLQTEPLDFSPLDYASMYACSVVLWEIAVKFESVLEEEYRVGRPRGCKVADVLLVDLLLNQFNSVRKVLRFLSDPRIWQIVAQSVESAWPDQPGFRLSEKPLSRYQFMRTREALVEGGFGFPKNFRLLAREAALEAGKFIGCGSAEDSLTHPSTRNMLMGDATWEQAMFNGDPSKRYVNRETGEISWSRSDPDARPYHSDEKRPGNYIVSVQQRTESGHERIILDTAYMDMPNGRDGEMFTDMVLDLIGSAGTVRGVAYDMALDAANQDRIGSTGRHVLCHVKRTTEDMARSKTIGSLEFSIGDRSFREEVTVVDGCPVIYVADIDGEEYAVPLVRVQSKLRSETLYNKFQIPTSEIVPFSKRGATTWIRPFSTKEEIKSGRRRSVYMRSIPNNDADFDALFGLREDTESMHNDMKSRKIERRARSVGLARRDFDLRGYQIHQNLVAVVAHSIRTGKNLGAFFGQWTPPERAQRLKAA